MIVGTLVTVLSAFLPALRGGRVSPLAAMRESAVEQVGSSRKRILGGLIVAALGVRRLSSRPLAGASSALLGIGVLLIWVGVLILGPVLALVAAKVIGTPVAKAFKVTGKMAQGNAARNPKRTSRAAAPVLIGVALVTAVALLATTLKAQVREIFGEQFVGDFVVKTDDFTGFGGLSPDLADAAQQAARSRCGSGHRREARRGRRQDLAGHAGRPATVGEVFDLHLTSGVVRRLSRRRR